jgi:hypothetical protein
MEGLVVGEEGWMDARRIRVIGERVDGCEENSSYWSSFPRVD